MAEVHEYKKKYQIIRPSVIQELLHGTKVSNMAYLVGKRMGLSEEDCHNLAIAGFVHDIGKLEIAKYVEGQSTLIIEEIRYVRVHASLGAEILKEKGYSEQIVNMVKHHHENCDGSGYPMNLFREQIPLGARILRVCDVFVALTADRPYRKALDIETTLQTMIDESKNYDVQVFLALMNVVHERDLTEILYPYDLQETLLKIMRR